MALSNAAGGSLADQVAAIRDGLAVCALQDRILEIRGADRATWLAGMVTNDLKGLTSGTAIYTAIVHVKGRILADAWIVSHGETIWIVLPEGTIDAVRAHLEAYVVMEDVEVVALEAVTVVSVQGPRASELRAAWSGGAMWATNRLGTGGFDAAVDVGAESQWRQAVDAVGGVIVSDDAWNTARLERAVPRFGVDFTTENFVQEATITPRAVSFNKGCYVGQEVVCRLEMRGNVRRQLAPLLLDGDPPSVGSEVRVDDQVIGTVTSAARSPATGRSMAFAMLKSDVVQDGASVVVAGRPAQIVARPTA